jgi:hypothetical protein
MTSHLYPCGRKVAVEMPLGQGRLAGFVIERLLPTNSDEPRYEVKHASETFRRAIFEHQIHPDLPTDGQNGDRPVRDRGAINAGLLEQGLTP